MAAVVHPVLTRKAPVFAFLTAFMLILTLPLMSTGIVAAFDRDPSLEFGRSLYNAGNRSPNGIWSDGTTIWVADAGDDKLYAYDLDDRTRVPAKDFDGLKAADNEHPSAGIWSDGTTMWVADSTDGKIYAYLTGSRAWDPARDFDTLRAAGNHEPAGIWSDGTTMWVADAGDDKIYAYVLATKARNSAQDFDTLSEVNNNDPRGIWSDGTTMWVADFEDDKIYAYDLATKARLPAREFETLQAAGNFAPSGIWSDGGTMWVADYRVGCNRFGSRGDCIEWGSGQGIYAYDMPVGTAPVSPTGPVADPAAFDRDPSLEFGRSLYNAGNRSPNGIWSDGTTIWVADAGDDKLYAYDLDDRTRVPAKDFDGLKAADNEHPSAGIWSDGTTMWVADNTDDKIYAYLTGSRAWDPARDFDTLRAAGNREPAGIWSDGTTMWVADAGDDKIYAYVLATKARNSAQDFDTLSEVNNNDPRGIWSDGTTMWVADFEDDKIYAYDLATKARLPAREFETLQAAGNFAPSGIWSDGGTMWVADYRVGCNRFGSRGDCIEWGSGQGIYAYDMPVGTAPVSPTGPVADPAAFDRDPSLEFGRSLYNAGNRSPNGIWSDGTTIWVADAGDDKLYAYDLDDRTRVPAKDFDGLKAAGNEHPSAGIWSDGTTMWVADNTDDKIYAYDMATKAQNSAREFDTLRAAGNREPAGIWSDGTTMWVADAGDDKIYAYVLATKARNSAQDFDTLSEVNNNDPRGIWSDGTTMWVADFEDDKIYAYDLATKARLPAREFETLQAAGNFAPSGIWSDGGTMWVADYRVGCNRFGSRGDCIEWGSGQGIYAYDMPPMPMPPGAATISSVIPGSGSLTVSWSAPPGDASGITAYDLRHILTTADENMDANWTLLDDAWTGTGPLRYEITGLTGGTEYDVQVRAVNSAGDGPWSVTATGTPAGPSATRSFSAAYVEPGGTLTVTITAADYGRVGRVTESLPQDFTYVSSTLPDLQVTEADARTVGFNLLGNASFSYDVTAPDVEGSYSFSGTLTDSERNEYVVGGADTVTVASGNPLVARYDANRNGEIEIDELFSAIDDYFNDVIGIDELFALIDLYFAGSN